MLLACLVGCCSCFGYFSSFIGEQTDKHFIPIKSLGLVHSSACLDCGWPTKCDANELSSLILLWPLIDPSILGRCNLVLL
ncbi:hypothetical protein MANES_16G079650v8 [Manihot esculenta]|uniref:Uncharacterized protein n=1 Tax=Manihot esculenta TaxID=3983 RepID=A0ACB7G6M8_MANES|nr:hypothetical protein MANES_16G079650v8 [Manihot esculenta]